MENLKTNTKDILIKYSIKFGIHLSIIITIIL